MKTLFLFALVIWPATCFAHPGGLDAAGCHHERKTGQYHCHK